MQVLDDLLHALCAKMRAVIRVGVNVERGNLEPAAGFERFEGLTEDVVVVADGPLEFAPMDEVEGLAVGPDLFKVVYFEAAVRGNPGFSFLV